MFLSQDERDVPDRLFVKAASLQMMQKAAQRYKKKMGRFTSMAGGRHSPSDHGPGSESPLSTLSPNWGPSTPPLVKGKVSQGKKADPE